MDFNTGSGPEGTQGSGGSAGGGGRPPGATASPGGEFDYRDPVQSFIRTVTSVVTRPVPFFNGLRKQGDFINPLVFALICSVVNAVLSGIISFFTALGTDAGVGTAIGGLFSAIILTPIFTAIGLFIFGAIFHLLVMLFVKPSNAGFEATFRVGAYASVTQLVSWASGIPILGIIVGLAVLAYSVFLGIVGIREMHSTTTGRAALIVLIPVAVILLLALLVGIAVLAAFMGTQQ